MAEVVDIREYTVEAVCSTVHVTPAMLRRYRLAGIVAPVRTTAHGARYDEAAVMRLRTVRRLMRDLGTNLAGAQVALHLLDQLAEAHREIARLRAQLAEAHREIARLRAQLAERHSPHAGDSA